VADIFGRSEIRGAAVVGKELVSVGAIKLLFFLKEQVKMSGFFDQPIDKYAMVHR
jgi:hypothetical protein